MTSTDIVMNFLTGPISALALAVAILWGLSRFAAKYLPQIIEKYFKQMDDQVEAQRQICQRLDEMKDSIGDQHTTQTEAMRKAVSGLHGRLNPIESDVKEIKAMMTLNREVSDGSNQ